MVKTLWILGDQLLRHHTALTNKDIKVLFIESTERLSQLHYQKKKLVLVLSAMRHFAQDLREQGYEVDYVYAEDFVSGIQSHLLRNPSTELITMAASEYKTRKLQQTLIDIVDIPVTILPNTQFLVEQFNPYPNPLPGKRYVMENFYRLMRKHFQVLMTAEGEPVGGEWNYDKLNREPLSKKIQLPAVEGFTPDAMTQSVMEQVDGYEGIGTVDNFNLAVTHQQAQIALDTFVSERLSKFGPYEDAMTQNSRIIFHSLLSPYLNIGLLEPLQLIQAAEQAYKEGRAPLNSVEGFIRQILGWREYMYWQYWQQMPELATVNHWQNLRPLPAFFWDGETKMNCLHHVVTGLLETGYGNHIERLMLVCNYCLLAGVNPQEVNDWFLCMYFDAYEWVVLPNVLGMGLNADGGKIATKPYIASANYINKMSDYCQNCHYNPKQRTGALACPYNVLYWNFLIDHESKLRANPRLGPNVLGLGKVSLAERAQIQQQAQTYLG